MKYLVEDFVQRQSKAAYLPVDRLEVLMFAELQLREANASCCRGNKRKYDHYHSERWIIYCFTPENIFKNLRLHFHVSITNATPLLYPMSYHF